MLIAKHGDVECFILPPLQPPRLITGATGTGKTVTLQVLSSGCPASACRCSWPTSRRPCGLSQPGRRRPNSRNACCSWSRTRVRRLPDGVLGHVRRAGPPVRATVSDLVPVAGAHPGLNDTQEGGYPRVQDRRRPRPAAAGPEDLRGCCSVGENAATFQTDYGNVSAASIGAIQRGLLGLDSRCRPVSGRPC